MTFHFFNTLLTAIASPAKLIIKADLHLICFYIKNLFLIHRQLRFVRYSFKNFIF